MKQINQSKLIKNQNQKIKQQEKVNKLKTIENQLRLILVGCSQLKT